MNTKPIISSALLIVATLMFGGCTKTIYDEVSFPQEEVSFSYDELPVKMNVLLDRVDLTFYKNASHCIYLDGEFMMQTAKGEKEVSLHNLVPDTQYKLYITAADGNKVLRCEHTFTTPKAYASLVGWREMDIYGHNEEAMLFMVPTTGGDFIDFVSPENPSSDYEYLLRRTTADGRVKWRKNIINLSATVSEEGNIAGWSSQHYEMNYFACRIAPETGDVVYRYVPKFTDGFIKSVYPCRDGGMALVGRSDAPYKYYFARLDASGQVIREELEGTQAEMLYDIHETTDDRLVAIGNSGPDTLVTITFDASGQMIHRSTYHLENADFNYNLSINRSLRDSQGNIYYVGICEMQTEYYYAPFVLMMKVNAQGEFEWVRTLYYEDEEMTPTSCYLIDDNQLCILYSVFHRVYYRTRIGFLSTDNQHYSDITLNADFQAVHAWPVNPEHTQFGLYDKYGREIFIDLEGMWVPSE